MKEFLAHSLILSVRSTYFKVALSKEWAKKDNGIITFKKPNISPEIYGINFKISLYWIIEYLKNDPINVIQFVFRYEGCEDLYIIILFLKNNELEMEEIKIWELILKWALERMSTQYDVDNLSQWTSSDFEELKKILHDLIPHIRWSIFPNQLYEDIMGYYCDPDTPPINAILPLRRYSSNSDSVLINRGHLSIIASWIDKKEKSFYNTKNTPYLFKLLYRASRDGFEAAKFHELCDNKVLEVGNLHQIASYFLLQKKGEINSASLIRVTNQFYVISYGLNYGPAFGG
ncbi:BTB/POZ protein [Rhizophagus clarus]|uniref:BTB/POZ protein n=1 Tax=Rhizophagus clarus TaxID=94130 RepID=A0A8H3L6B3_9GLOM|nr:BTB/POZ protein [Rhizophagus clarus]